MKCKDATLRHFKVIYYHFLAWVFLKFQKIIKKTQVRLQRLFEIKYVTATNISCDEENF